MNKFFTLFILSAFLLAACERDTTYDAFSQCLADSGVKYYGAFWCPNCQNQTKMFGDSKDLVPYIECDQNGKDSQYALCNQENITKYPTWKFPDGRIETGVQTLEDLSAWSGCALPGEESVMLKDTAN